MKRIDELRREADQRRLKFIHSLDDVRLKLKPARLLDESLGSLDPKFSLLRRLAAEARKNPMAILALASGFWMLGRGLAPGTANRLRNMTHRAGQSRLAPIVTTGDHHGHKSNTEHS